MKVDNILKLRGNKIMNKIIHKYLQNKGIDIPSTVKIGKNVKFPHNSYGTVIHPNTIIEDNVKIYQNVTIGRADIENEINESKFDKIIIKKGAILGAGCKVLCKEGILTIEENTIIGANAVLTKSTNKNEIWAGIPAKKIGERK